MLGFETLETVWRILSGRSGAQMARISAYLLAPALILGIALSGYYGGGLAVDPVKPVAISELRTEMNAQGDATSKPGVAVIVNPTASEYRIPLGSRPTRVWSSLDEQEVHANRDRLYMDGNGLNGKAPFLGVNGPVTVVVEGVLGTDILVPGGKELVDEWRLSSTRSGSIVSSVLLACVFSFGLSLATALPSVPRDQGTARQESA